eukprot:6210603-Pleurochrysis_carterae.AAC.2
MMREICAVAMTRSAQGAPRRRADLSLWRLGGACSSSCRAGSAAILLPTAAISRTFQLSRAMSMLAWCGVAVLSRPMVEGYEKNLSGYWNNADKEYAHINYNGYLAGEKKLIQAWTDWWLKYSPVSMHRRDVFENATVMEYGIGGGLLGKHLLEKYKVRHYIGVDIAERQLEEASNRLDACCRFKYSRLKVDHILDDVDLNPFRIDVFVSQAVMQHFPSNVYTRKFLGVLSRSRIPFLMLQVRELDVKLQGISMEYAQFVTRDLLATHLPNYEMLWQSKREPNGYVFYWWHLRT